MGGAIRIGVSPRRNLIRCAEFLSGVRDISVIKYIAPFSLRTEGDAPVQNENLHNAPRRPKFDKMHHLSRMLRLYLTPFL